jgi:ribosomal protein S18 acetylase RimI-like enzyme
MASTTRLATAADLTAVLALWSEAGAEPSHTDDIKNLEQLIAHDPGALIVVEDDGRIVGSVIAAWDGWRGSVYRLVVAPTHRRIGLGLGLLAEADRRLSELGAVRLHAIVVEEDTPATGFWRSTGWECQLGRQRFVKG